MSFSYRIQIKLTKTKGFNCDETIYKLENIEGYRPIQIKSAREGEKIQDAEDLVFFSEGFNSFEDAEKEGGKVLNTIIRSFLKLKKGIDFGARGTSFQITKEGLKYFEEVLGVKRMLPGGLGLKVYASSPQPKFVTPKTELKISSPIAHFENAFTQAISNYRELNSTELLSTQLFNSSFFEEIPESRFLLLVMAIEILIQCKPRSIEVKNHIERMIELTNTNNEINDSDKKSIKGSLSWLKNQSIGQAGRELSRKLLGETKYYGMSAARFFTHCYDIRCTLVHGNSTLQSKEVIGLLSLELEKFVSDLLTMDMNQ